MRNYPEEKTETFSSEDTPYTLTDTESGYRDLDTEARGRTGDMRALFLLAMWFAAGVAVPCGALVIAAIIWF